MQRCKLLEIKLELQLYRQMEGRLLLLLLLLLLLMLLLLLLMIPFAVCVWQLIKRTLSYPVATNVCAAGAHKHL